jgi:hypothetical protein
VTSSNELDTIITANARMWQGQYEYLGITITVNRKDSLFVKGIIVKPSLGDDKFYPWFDHYSMYSYYYGDEDNPGYKGQYEGGYHWQDYFGKRFDDLPKENRKTNKGDSHVSYTAYYHSKKSIDFERFAADIEVLLVDNSGGTVTHKKHFDFRGKKKCRFSAH